MQLLSAPLPRRLVAYNVETQCIASQAVVVAIVIVLLPSENYIRTY
jgi:hypothetical protein